MGRRCLLLGRGHGGAGGGYPGPCVLCHHPRLPLCSPKSQNGRCRVLVNTTVGPNLNFLQLLVSLAVLILVLFSSNHCQVQNLSELTGCSEAGSRWRPRPRVACTPTGLLLQPWRWKGLAGRVLPRRSVVRPGWWVSLGRSPAPPIPGVPKPLPTTVSADPGDACPVHCGPSSRMGSGCVFLVSKVSVDTRVRFRSAGNPHPGSLCTGKGPLGPRSPGRDWKRPSDGAWGSSPQSSTILSDPRWAGLGVLLKEIWSLKKAVAVSAGRPGPKCVAHSTAKVDGSRGTWERPGVRWPCTPLHPGPPLLPQSPSPAFRRPCALPVG